MKLIDIDESRDMPREEAAAVLRKIADSLARHNDLEFTRDGVRYTVDVADTVNLEVELEVGDDGSSLEIELNW